MIVLEIKGGVYRTVKTIDKIHTVQEFVQFLLTCRVECIQTKGCMYVYGSTHSRVVHLYCAFLDLLCEMLSYHRYHILLGT